MSTFDRFCLKLTLVAATGCAHCADPAASTPIECEFVTKALQSVDATAHVGYTAADVIAFSTGDAFSTTVVWTDQNAADVQPSRSPSLRTTVQYRDGKLTDSYVERQPAALPGCLPQLSIGVDVRVQSDDGLFDETRSGTLVSTVEGKASISLEIPADELKGTLRLEPTAAGWTIRAISLLLEISPNALTGEVLALSQREQGGVSPTQVDLALAGGEFRVADLQ